jgi:hypothetical protein
MYVFFISWCLVDTLSITRYSDFYTCDKIIHREHYNLLRLFCKLILLQFEYLETFMHIFCTVIGVLFDTLA